MLEDLDPLHHPLDDVGLDGSRGVEVETPIFFSDWPMRSIRPMRCSTSHGIPGQVVVDDRRAELEIETLARHLAGEEQVDFTSSKVGHDALAAVFGHAAVEHADSEVPA